MNNVYPLWKVVFEQIPIHNSKTASYSIYVKLDEQTNWLKLYETVSEPWSKIALIKLQELFDVYICKWIKDIDSVPTMFELNNQIYKTTYVIPSQSCICGEHILGNTHYGQLDEYDQKFDYIQSIIFFYNKGECLVKGNQLFLDGELLLNSEQLDEVCEAIGQEKLYLDSSLDKLINYISQHYPSATSYTCNGYSNYDIKNNM